MKKILIGLALVFLVTGCSGINSSVAVNAATDTAFVLALQNNPSYKAPVVKALNDVKAILEGEITYDFLIAEITKRFDGKYAAIGLILRGYLETDKPVFETYLNLRDDYRKAAIAKIDRFIMLAGV
jgi:hypothetical protein